MGPRKLNQFFRFHNPLGIIEKQLKEFNGKTIVIDASIYLYRFNTNDELIENLYIMICIFKKHNIIPLFIFDGKPPPEKFNSLNIRRKERDNAARLYELLKKSKNMCEVSATFIEKLKRKKTRVNSRNRDEAKRLLEVCGVSYIEADGEADELCAYCVIKNIAYACLSDDMDMFIYGCPRIMRYFSMMNETIVYYELETILKSLDIEKEVFINIAILSGTDYNNEVMLIEDLYVSYSKNKEMFSENLTSKIERNEYENIKEIKKYYDLTKREFNEVLSRRKYFNYDKQEEQKFLSSYHFIFIE